LKLKIGYRKGLRDVLKEVQHSCKKVEGRKGKGKGKRGKGREGKGKEREEEGTKAFCLLVREFS